MQSKNAGFNNRAERFIELAERVTTLTDNREVIFAAIFGHRGLYINEFPTLDERMAFRDVPFAREKLFSLL